MRVVVGDDVLLMRQGIVHVLEAGGDEVVGEAGDLSGLLAAVRAHEPDVVIIDIRMPPTHTTEGLQAAERIAADHPGTGILILSQHIEPEYAMSRSSTIRRASATC